MIKVIEASNDQELALKVTEAINAGTLPYGDWEYREGRFIVLTTDGTPDGPGGFQLVWGISSGHISAVAEPLIQQGWLAFGAVKVANGQYVQALTLGVPANSGGGIKEVYAADIVDSTQLGRTLLTAADQVTALTALGGTDIGIDLFTAVDVNAAHDALLAGVFGLSVYKAADQDAAHTLLGAGEAGLAVYRGATKEAIKTYLDIGGGSVTVDSITDAGTAGKDVLRAATAVAARNAMGATTIGNSLFTATTTQAARTAIGATTVGHALITASSKYAGQLAIGVGTVGSNVFESSTKTQAATALGSAFNMRTYESSTYVPGVGVDDEVFRIHASLVGETLPNGAKASVTITDALPASSGLYELPAVNFNILSGGQPSVGIGSITVLSGSAGYTQGDIVTVRNDVVVNRVPFRAQGGITRVGTTTVNIGENSLPFTNIYLTNQPVVTSDVREKHDPEAIADAVLDAWQDVLFVQFRHKGDEQGEIHFGVVAQQVKQIFENHNLDPMAYGLLCYEEWDAVPEDRDEETGEIITPAREAGNRYGVRYQECMILEAALTRRTIQRMQSGA